MHARALEVLRPLGVTEQLLHRARIAPEVRVHLGRRVVSARLGDFAMTDTAFPHLVLLRQTDVETVLAQAVEDRGIRVERGTELVELKDARQEAHVTLQSERGLERLNCAFAVGCDGQTSQVRSQAGIGWRGGPYAQEAILADVELDGCLTPDAAHAVAWRGGLLVAFALGEYATWRLLATRPCTTEQLAFGQPGPPVSQAALQAIVDRTGLEARITCLAWSASYPLQHRLAAQFRRGRVYLAGDAAHAYSPATGQGMNTGILDATNLGWKLAFACASEAPATVLDSYERERLPVARRVLALTHMAFTAEASSSPVAASLRGILAPVAGFLLPVLLTRPQLLALGARLLAQMWVAYSDSPLSLEGTPRLSGGARAGHRLPDGAVRVNGRSVSLHGLLAGPGVHVLLQRDADHLEELSIPHVTVHRLTSVRGSGVVAVRPDGHVGFRSAVVDVGQLRSWLERLGLRQ
jgi:2-polyprenyl-6-methoxyphenol hydroxylase-like FAD-dependent oxidoreductase